MDILGVGPLELVFILIIALIILGPNDMVKAGRTLGRWLRKLVTSPTWSAVQQTSRDLKNLPNKLMREAGLEELQKEIPDMNDLSKSMELNQINKELQETQKDISVLVTPPHISKTTNTKRDATQSAQNDPAITGPEKQADTTPTIR